MPFSCLFDVQRQLIGISSPLPWFFPSLLRNEPFVLSYRHPHRIILWQHNVCFMSALYSPANVQSVKFLPHKHHFYLWANAESCFINHTYIFTYVALQSAVLVFMSFFYELSPGLSLGLGWTFWRTLPPPAATPVLKGAADSSRVYSIYYYTIWWYSVLLYRVIFFAALSVCKYMQI